MKKILATNPATITALIARLALGIVVFPHEAQKLFGWFGGYGFSGTRASKVQTFHEWFRQKKTQKKYLIQQIAALKVYLGYVQKGYSIAQKGLTTVSNIKKGNFDLHCIEISLVLKKRAV